MIDGVNVGMLNTGNLFANHNYLFLPGRLGGLGGKRRDVVSGGVEVVYQGVPASGGRGPGLVSKRERGGRDGGEGEGDGFVEVREERKRALVELNSAEVPA